MKPYTEMTTPELQEEFEIMSQEYRKFQAMDLNLNMSRGKPCREQLDLSMGMMDALNSEADLSYDSITEIIDNDDNELIKYMEGRNNE